MGPTLRFGLAFSILVSQSLLLLAQEPFDFAITEAFLKQLADGKTLQPKLKVKMEHRTRHVHTLANDCELHIAGTPVGPTLGDPPSIVVEPPNLCKFAPVGNTSRPSERRLREEVWPQLLDAKVMRRECEVKGFPRIFTEHASGGGEGGANPNHVFEIHPAMAVTCDGDTVAFESFLTFIPGMRHIRPSTAASCLENRQLEVRHRQGQYEFRERGGQCGNFAIVEVSSLNKEWIHPITGGHSAIARVSPNGQSRTTLKLYTLTPSAADRWLAKVKQDGLGNERKLVHGMITYDFYAIVKTVRTEAGEWQKPSTWTRVEFPLALVIFGEAQTAPWVEE